MYLETILCEGRILVSTKWLHGDPSSLLMMISRSTITITKDCNTRRYISSYKFERGENERIRESQKVLVQWVYK
jgi:hypothetical protein